jgi:hypothetical protein
MGRVGHLATLHPVHLAPQTGGTVTRFLLSWCREVAEKLTTSLGTPGNSGESLKVGAGAAPW